MLLDLGLFALSAVVVWFAGARVTALAQEIAERTGLGQAFIGLLLLGGITSLPELATTVTASAHGNAALAVNNILGGVAAQVVVLAGVDALIGDDAISAVVAKPNVLLIGVLGIFMLVVVAAVVVAGDAPLLGVGAGSTAIFVLFLLSLWRVNAARTHESWKPAQPLADHQQDEQARSKVADWSTLKIASMTLLLAALITGAGYLMATRAEALAEETGLGSSFMGAALVAIGTSLPEITTTAAAVRLHRYELAFGDIFGTNLFDIALLFVADAVYAGGPVLNQVNGFSVVAALLGCALTAIFLAGLIERRNRAVLRMGVDSLAVIVLYIAGLALLFTMRS